MDRLENLVRELRASAGAATPPAEGDQPSSAPQGTRASRPRHQRPALAAQARWRRPLLIGGGVLAGLLAVAALLPKHPSTTPKLLTPPTHSVQAVDSGTTFAATPTPLQWKAVIEQLDLRRGLAFIHADFREFYNIDADGSAALNTDQAMTMALRNVRAHAESFPLRVKSVTEQYVTVGERVPRAMLTVVDEMGAYNLIDAQGKVLRHIPARGERRWSVELERSSLWGWLYVSAVSAASP